MVRVKICGIRSPRDLEIAVMAGADAIGLILGARHRTEDELSPAAGAELLRAVPIFISSLLVTHLVTAREIAGLHALVKTDIIQLHDDITVDEIVTLKTLLPATRLVKAIHVEGADSIGIAKQYEDVVDALLLDTKAGDRIGGTGIVHDWQVSKRIAAGSRKPVVLAGGIKPENVAEAIRRVRPHAIDVNSGVEDASGAKDFDEVRRLVRIAKGFE